MSENLQFDFSVPCVAPAAEPVRAQARRTRKLGQIAAGLHRSTLWRKMLAIYAQGARTDAEMALALGIERTTVNARRAELVALGKVEDSKQTRKNPKSHVENTLWQLRKDA